MVEHKGTIKYISEKSGGCVLEGEPDTWYNPEKGYTVPKEYLGKNVVMQINPKNIISDIQLDVPPAPTQKPVVIHNSEKLIIRQVAIKTAVELAKSMEAPNMEFVKKAAAEIEGWILR